MVVFVELEGDPVAVVQHKAAGRLVTDVERETVASDLRAQQRPLASEIEAMGGTVMATFQHALNGIKVRIAADRVGSLALLPGVKGLRHVGTYTINDDLSMPFIGAPAAWQGTPGFHGEGVNVVDIDTGIDFMHANFAGPGTVAAFNDAFAASRLPADPAFFGPNAPRVKGGTDLVGDDYTGNNTPQPDPNPLDCNGHGSHTAGTIGGSGVTTAGTTFTGPYDNTTFVNNTTWNVGPGVAPEANIYAVRVFGCQGSTRVVDEAIEWAVDSSPSGGHPGIQMNVINMSLGSDFGNAESSDAVASTNAVNAGIIVAAASGNAGNAIPFITSSPAAGAQVLSVAAIDSHLGTPGATLALSPSGTTITVQNSTGATVTTGSFPVVVAQNNPNEAAGIGNVGLGCLDSDYANAAGKIVVAARGVCARIYRVQAAFHHGAAAAALVNNGAGLGVFEGPVQSCVVGAPADNSVARPCDPGETPVLVTIPMFGVNGLSATALSADAIALAGSASASPAPAADIPNPTASQIASFSSAGPLMGYSADGFVSEVGHLKPNITGPGVSINSTGIGTGNQGLIESGTSMATPHVAGSAALAVQSHPGWSADDVRVALANTASPAKVSGWSPKTAGGGLVQPFPATQTTVVARGETGDEADLSLGSVDITSDLTTTKRITVRNLGSRNATFNVTATKWGGSVAHNVSVSPATVTVRGGSSAKINVTLAVPAATAGSSAALREVGGFVSLTPTAGSNGGATVNVPYYMISHGRSQVGLDIKKPFSGRHPTTTGTIVNASASVTGSFDFYAQGGSGNALLGAHGIRAAGVKAAPSGTDRLITFAVQTFRPNATYDANNISNEVDITFPGNTTGIPDWSLFTEDLGAAQGLANTGQIVVITVNNATGAAFAQFLATAPFDSTVTLLPVLASRIGLTAAGVNQFSYTATHFFVADDTSPTGLISDSTQAASFTPFAPAFTASVGAATIGPAATTTVNLTIDPVQFAAAPAKGIMMVTRENSNLDNKRGQAVLIDLE
jgi:hypothetical protein